MRACVRRHCITTDLSPRWRILFRRLGRAAHKLSSETIVNSQYQDRQPLSGLRETRLVSSTLQPEAMNYTLREFEHRLECARARSAQDRERVVAREKDLQDQLQRLTAAVAESGHSPVLLRAIAEREQELGEIRRLASDNDASRQSPEHFPQFITERLSRLPELLSMDVMRARAELTRHVTHITMIPESANGAQYYACQGEWNLLGTPRSTGDVRMVAGGGFEPPTFGL